MASNDHERSDKFLPDGTAIRSEDIGFAPGELAVCRNCGRNNAPDRPKCIYCGEMLSPAVFEAPPATFGGPMTSNPDTT